MSNFLQNTLVLPFDIYVVFTLSIPYVYTDRCAKMERYCNYQFEIGIHNFPIMYMSKMNNRRTILMQKMDISLYFYF